MEYIDAKTLVVKTKNSNWFATDYTMNIYKGCSHGCIYCDSRSECYKIEDFDMVRAKRNSLNIIERELRSKKQRGVVATGSMSDPYNKNEEKECLTREALKLLDKYGFGVAIATKSDLVVRDIDILKKISRHSPVIVKITITNYDDEISKLTEPNVSLSSKRFEALKILSENGIFAGILMMPVLPFISDSLENIDFMIERGKESRVKFIYPFLGVTLRDRQRELFLKRLDEKFPNVKEKYIKYYKNSYVCRSIHMRQYNKYFAKRCTENKILFRMNDICIAYKKDYTIEQISLF